MAQLRNGLRWGIVLSMVLATIAIGATPVAGQSEQPLFEKYDENNNNDLELDEVQHAINVWAAGNMTDVDEDGTTIDEVQTLISQWAN